MIRNVILTLNRVKTLLAIGVFLVFGGAALAGKQLLGLPAATIRDYSLLAIAATGGGAVLIAVTGLAIKRFCLGLGGNAFFRHSGAQVTSALGSSNLKPSERSCLLTYLLIESLLIVLLSVLATGVVLILYVK